jgi:hypothetical protein
MPGWYFDEVKTAFISNIFQFINHLSFYCSTMYGPAIDSVRYIPYKNLKNATERKGFLLRLDCTKEKDNFGNYCALSWRHCKVIFAHSKKVESQLQCTVTLLTKPNRVLTAAEHWKCKFAMVTFLFFICRYIKLVWFSSHRALSAASLKVYKPCRHSSRAVILDLLRVMSVCHSYKNCIPTIVKVERIFSWEVCFYVYSLAFLLL